MDAADIQPQAPNLPGLQLSSVGQLFIPASASLQERRPRTLKHGDTFAVFDHNGDVISGPGSPEGIFHRDTRYLSHFYMTIGGVRPMLLSSTLRDDNATLTCDLTNPDLYDASGKLVLEHDLLHLRRTRFLWQGRCLERLLVKNFDDQPHEISIDFAISADFADLFEVRGTERRKRGTQGAAVSKQDGLELSYTGLDGCRRSTTLRFEPAPKRITAEQITYRIQLQPGQSRSIFIEIACNSGAEASPTVAFFKGFRDARRALRQASSRAAAVQTSNDIFNEALRRSVSDIYMLMTDTPEGPYPYAGIPWFSTVFGRDAIITALQTLWLDPAIAKGVLRHLAANQAKDVDPAADAEPGKILHEVRYGEMAELGEVPFRRYYGSVDSTPLFVMLAGAYLERTGDLETLRGLWPNIEAALAWLEDYGDRDGDGFVEYGRMTEDGLVNQGWKDSYDSVFHADGTLAKGPIALAEVQAYTYGAFSAAALICRRLGRREQASQYSARAAALQSAFDAAFFDDSLGTFVLALDGDKRACRVRASNAGHALLTGVAYPERAEAVVKTLMEPSSFCGWGIRTVPSTEARYNPMSYHNGSVWPHDNSLIASGLGRYGFRKEASKVFEGLFAASTYIDLRRLPELFCGFRRQRAQGPTFYPVACAPQAWAAAAPLSLLQSSLGLSFDPQNTQVIFERPVLPAFLDEVVIRNLTVGSGAADVALHRAGHQVTVEVLDRRGAVKVVSVT
ncbi:amylo-alpha-1,6-glucosidase [Rhizobium sp. NTR19]|uniref:Amylo-alpha-1,6-glucosidase n=1 Tax=Neorhizobium turbinariae TaxID=2937795 RepID=A0ABT0IQ22_9HYPH|nr:amylo-alpha-1,6-glucosidase [Neorhizobium turbinariae]MCK8779982.1 amylo-alpha-1,6-glucosidase [Neorhizobium turbinariae]